MRFVTPEVVRIDLKDGPNGEKNWIEIVKELSKGEDAQMRSSGLKRMSQGDDKTTEIGVDWCDLAMGRVIAYLRDWSAKHPVTGKDIKCTPKAIAELSTEDFDEIDAAIQKHIADLEAEKKRNAGEPQPATTS